MFSWGFPLEKPSILGSPHMEPQPCQGFPFQAPARTAMSCWCPWDCPCHPRRSARPDGRVTQLGRNMGESLALEIPAKVEKSQVSHGFRMAPCVIKHGWLENPQMEVLGGRLLISGPFSSTPCLITRGYHPKRGAAGWMMIWEYQYEQ